MTSVAIIGAGLGGLSAAHILEAHGAHVTLFDKGHFPGGRLATRRSRDSSVTYDHGAQYFTVKHPLFEMWTERLIVEGVVAPWKGRIMSIEAPGTFEETNPRVTRYVGAPHMNAIAEHLASTLNTRMFTRVAHITRADDARFSLGAQEERDLGEFDAVLLNMPPLQAGELLEQLEAPELSEACRAHTMQPCWAVMLQHDFSTFDGAFVNIEDSPLSWVARDTSKPGRASTDQSTWVLHATHTWSQAHIEAAREQVADALYGEFLRLTRLDDRAPASIQAHRWRYAIPEDKDEDRGSLIAANFPVAICGDWLKGGRVEGAFLSGVSSAHALIARLGLTPVRALAPWQQPDRKVSSLNYRG